MHLCSTVREMRTRLLLPTTHPVPLTAWAGRGEAALLPGENLEVQGFGKWGASQHCHAARVLQQGYPFGPVMFFSVAIVQ